MPPPIDCDNWVQALFAEATRDDLGMIDFVLGNQLPLPPDSDARWQFGLDFFYRCKKSELFVIVAIWDRSKLDGLLDLLAEQSPFAGGGGWAWIGTYVRATQRLRDLFARFPEADALAGPPCAGFMAALGSIFAESGVGWAATPLISIHPAAA